jgi:hypothetical protein
MAASLISSYRCNRTSRPRRSYNYRLILKRNFLRHNRSRSLNAHPFMRALPATKPKENSFICRWSWTTTAIKSFRLRMCSNSHNLLIFNRETSVTALLGSNNFRAHWCQLKITPSGVKYKPSKLRVFEFLYSFYFPHSMLKLQRFFILRWSCLQIFEVFSLRCDLNNSLLLLKNSIVIWCNIFFFVFFS